MTPNREPNALPQSYLDWGEWRNAYKSVIEDYNKTNKTFSGGVLLEIRLKRLGFSGLNLFHEVMHVRENVPSTAN